MEDYHCHITKMVIVAIMQQEQCHIVKMPIKNI